MVFGVIRGGGLLGIVAGQIDHGVFIAGAIGGVLGDAQRQGAAVARGLVGKLVDHAFGQALPHHRDGGFGQNHNVGMGVRHLIVIALNGRRYLRFGPFQRLRNIALRQRHGGAAAVGMGEFGLAGEVAAQQQCGNGGGGTEAGFGAAGAVYQQNQPSAEAGGGQRNQMNAADGGKAGQRAAIGNLRITERAPAEAGEQALAGEFG